jgi:excisionase family DNA binding protein
MLVSPTHTFDPVHVLGTSTEQAVALLRGRPVTPGEVEAVAMTAYPWRRHVHDPHSYWLTAGQAADLLGVSAQVVRQLLDRNRLPHVTHTSGVRLMRRSDISTIAERRRLPRQHGRR